jgi:Transposase DDE domain
MAGASVCSPRQLRFARSGSLTRVGPTGECKPASVWVKATRIHPLIPRDTDRWRKLYRRRASVEREFGRLKHEWALLPWRVRGIEKVRLHADLTILAKLACALARARAVPLAA